MANTSERGGSPEQAALALFRQVAERVPGYGAFLAEHGVRPGDVTTPADFARLPMTTKENYIRRHPLPAVCRDGVIGDMIAVSSGSTGAPTFWPRSAADEAAVADRFEQVLADAFGARGERTLAVVCFALGTWVGGLFTLACCRHLAARGLPITAIAPGTDKREILRVIPELAPHFDQVVLLGYPPFLKDVIDAGAAAGVPWADYRLGLVTAGEVFSEEWRTLVCERAGIPDPVLRTASLYGTADAGVLANETPLSIDARRFLASRPEAARELFGAARLPTLAQYDPYSRLFETDGGTLLFTGDNGVPLIRYHIADEGGLIGHEELLSFLRARGHRPAVPTEPALPFVYVFGRGRFAVSYYGANVYPENVSVGLEQPEVNAMVTGKFVMEVVEDESRDRRLHITVEAAPGLDLAGDRGAELAIGVAVLAQLRRLNGEFATYVPPDRQPPVIRLRPAGDPEHFPPGVKHRYTRH
ncbi:phenylacetate--CoA ligase family protein [Spongiactinospora sp. TRM90649]|uniref:phenylacetate--CoA ligase family protein n=1 Tax=Spongiactinospora sp. TRM90649 TaxID=3031114 RepID=UPI0023F74F8C|nr:phenylacetate--CoA ligase family protein [Spongiactinospora sp. TRM90649]MDF5752292.1 phenylacetate--CoA ligase family protein [Spongiactinospora sp. TRM90649]